MKKILVGTIGIISVVIFSFLPLREAGAVAQWARKYKMNCQACHTSFPRLTYFGEKFQRNGFQLPDTQDGDENKEKLSDTTFVDNVINMFGMRIAVTPVAVTTAGLTRPNGTIVTKTSFGNTDWLQFFTAGSIFKNTSIFIETEIQNTSVKHNWFTLGYHNLFDKSWLNLRVGKLGVMNWHAMNGRLRMIPNISLQGWSAVKTSEGTRTTGTGAFTINDQIVISDPQPGIELYGYQGPFLYSVGVVNGSQLTDNNEFKNIFGTLRLELPKGPLMGSSISVFGYGGTDTASTGIVRGQNRFYRISGATNLRWKKLDVLGGYIYNHDRDWDILTAGIQGNTIHSVAAQLGYLFDPKWFAALQYDFVKDSDNGGSSAAAALDGPPPGSATTTGTNDYHKISPSVWFMPRENMRIGLVSRAELQKHAGGRQHEFIVHVRSMF